MNDSNQLDSRAAVVQAGVSLCRQGRFTDAESVVRRGLETYPDYFEALHLLGCIASQTGRPAAAVELLQRAIRQNEKVAAAHCHLGQALRALGQLNDALASYSRAIALGDFLQPSYAGRALSWLSLGRHAEALADFDRTTALGADDADTHTFRASALLGLRRPAEALASCERAVLLAPGSSAAHVNRGIALHSLRRYDEALAGSERAIELEPRFADAHACRGAALVELRRVDEALQSADQALALRPNDAGMHNLRALCLLDLQRPAEAIASCERALELRSNLADAHNTLGLALSSSKSFERANASFDRAIALQPERSEPYFNKGVNHLLTGEFPSGWELYERRLTAQRAVGDHLGGSPWDGSANIAGKTLFIYAEQGLGDTLQFCRYAKLLMRDGAHVILSVQDSLRALLRGLDPGIELIGPAQRPRHYDFHCPLLSLPRAYRTRLDNIPSTVPYLEVDPERVARWRERLGTHGRLIGIRWQGGTSRADVGRSFALRQLEPLVGVPGVRLISLQRDAGCEQLRSLPAHWHVEDIGNELDADEGNTFLDTAAVMQCLELIITSDTSVAHLAGALGRPTWLALKHVPDWRWLLDRDDSPWYPTMRLFRQARPGDWDGVFARMRAELAQRTSDADGAAVRAQPDAQPILETAFRSIRLGHYDEAVEAFTEVLVLEPRNTDALRGRAQCLFILGRLEEAADAYDTLLAIAPRMDYMIGERLHVKLHSCDWRDYEQSRLAIAERVRRGERADVPGCFMCHSDSPADQLTCARIYSKHLCALAQPAPRPAARPARDRIRIAYLSADFCTHATTQLAAGLFEKHDRTRFETYAVSFGPNDGSAMRRRIEAAFEHFIDVRGWSDEDIAARVAHLEVDIAVDLKGHTLGARPRIFALRPAPVQVSFLGYPGTLGADFIDYIVADKVVIPDGEEAHYDESVIYLPDSYQVNDEARTSVRVPSRTEAGLPEKGFVFCCFNSVYKITPVVFDSWMRILAAVPGSILWLLGGTAVAERNLRRAAQERGIDARRIVFAARVAAPDHCARTALADLFLDTLPVNSHTTASDALWAGVPLITVTGKTFTARVATSLLRAVGLPQLSVATLADYERLALRLAQDRDARAALKQHLLGARGTLFDSGSYARRLEAAFAEIWRRCRHGEARRPLTIGAAGLGAVGETRLAGRGRPGLSDA